MEQTPKENSKNSSNYYQERYVNSDERNITCARFSKRKISFHSWRKVNRYNSTLGEKQNGSRPLQETTSEQFSR